jgi:hypothetical protein
MLFAVGVVTGAILSLSAKRLRFSEVSRPGGDKFAGTRVHSRRQLDLRHMLSGPGAEPEPLRPAA